MGRRRTNQHFAEVYKLKGWLWDGFCCSVAHDVPLFVTPWTAACQLPCPSLSPGAYSNSYPLSQWCHPTISSSVVPFSSCLQSFPASGSFPVSRLFTSGGQSIGASASNECSGLISSRIDWFDLLAVQGTLKSLLQHHSSKAPILQCSAFFMVQLSHPYMTTGKTIALTVWTFVGKVMSLLLNELSKFVMYSWASPVAQLVNPTAMRETWVWSLGWEDPLKKGKATHTSVFWSGEFHGLYSPWSCKESDMTERLSLSLLPRSKRLLISGLQSPSAVILEAKKIKVSHSFHSFPIYLPWRDRDGTGCHDLHFF